MGSNRVLSHQLSNGLYVSGAPDQYKDRQPIMTSTAMPYTGGDIKKSGELGKMFAIPVEAPKSKNSGPIPGGAARGGSFRAASSNSGPLAGNNPPRSSYPNNNSGPQSGPLTGPGGANRQGQHSGPLSRNGDPVKGGPAGVNLKTSGPLSSGGTPGMVRQNSGPLAPNLPATGLITSGPITSGPLSSSGAPRKLSGPMDGGAPVKLAAGPLANNHAITYGSRDQSYSLRTAFPRVILWTVILLFVIGFVAGGFILGAVQNAILLIIVVCLFGAVLLLVTWNAWVGKAAVIKFVASYPDVGLSQAKDGQYVKVTGVYINKENLIAFILVSLGCEGCMVPKMLAISVSQGLVSGHQGNQPICGSVKQPAGNQNSNEMDNQVRRVREDWKAG